MGELVDITHRLRNNSEYNNQAGAILEELQKCADDLMCMALNLAAAGRLKEWRDTMPTGDSFGFHDAMLYNTGDENVTGIMKLRDRVFELIEILQKSSPES